MNTHLHRLIAVTFLLAGLIAAPFSARAAESYDNCAGFIDSLPATIATQGVWCLRHDLNTGMASGNAITITTNNVTIDCNYFKVGGLAAGLATQTSGIYALNRLNATVRHCNIRGFRTGVMLNGGGGHVVEDNRFDSNTAIGIFVAGDGSVLRRNQVTDTGGSTGSTYGIYTVNAVDVLDNTVSGGDVLTYGIITLYNPSGSLSGNRVREAISGIVNTSSGRISLARNHVVNASGGLVGLSCADSHGRAMGNTINGFGTGIENCGYLASDGNVVVP